MTTSMDARRTSSAIERALSWATKIEVWAVVAVIVPVMAAVARHSGDRWIPIGDNALVEIRSRDVFSWRHFPLLGTWSSASLTAGKDLNHPGPLLFDLLAVPVRLFGGSTGVAVGVGLINIAAIVGVAVVGHRRLGRTGSLAGTAVAAALAWTLGSSMLTDPWNPHVLILPCLLMLVLTWAVASGDIVMLPWLLATASLCLQNHLGYAYLAPSLCLAALAGAVVVYRRRWRLDADARAADSARLRRTGAMSVATMLVLWAQPLWEQMFGEGQGNLTRILSSTGSDEPTVGARLGTRIVAAVVALPPFWGRSSFVGTVVHAPYDADGITIHPVGLPGLAISVASLVVVFALMAVSAAVAWKRRDRPGLAAVAVAIVALVLALGSLTIMPIGPLGLTPHQMRWLWPVSAFVVLALVLALVAPLAHRAVRGALVMVCLVFAALNAPAHVQLAGPDTFQESIHVARSLNDQLVGYRSDAAIWFDTRGLRYLEPYSAAVIAALQQAEVDVRVDDPGLVRQLGTARRADGGESLRLYLREGHEALSAPDGVERIAFTTPLSAGELDELSAGEAAMVDEIALMGIEFTASGSAAIEAGTFVFTRAEIEEQALDAAGFVASGLAARLVDADALVLAPSVAEFFERAADLRNRLGTTTVAVFVEPIPPAGASG